jgi:hypothetical protein
VLVFEAQTSKLADLGCASKRVLNGPADDWRISGDPAYAPPEARYGHEEPDWNRRRIGCDLYLLGSMIAFFFLDTSSLGLLFERLPAEFHPHPGPWTGTYLEVMPAIRHAFNETLSEFDDLALPQPLIQSLKEMYGQLCDPDPLKRGDRSRPINKLALERYLSRLDLLARRAESGLYKGEVLSVSTS